MFARIWDINPILKFDRWLDWFNVHSRIKLEKLYH